MIPTAEKSTHAAGRPLAGEFGIGMNDRIGREAAASHPGRKPKVRSWSENPVKRPFGYRAIAGRCRGAVRPSGEARSSAVGHGGASDLRSALRGGWR